VKHLTAFFEVLTYLSVAGIHRQVSNEHLQVLSHSQFVIYPGSSPIRHRYNPAGQLLSKLRKSTEGERKAGAA